MADRVALSVKASQDQQNNSVKHPETVSLIVYFKLYVYFEWSPPVSWCAQHVDTTRAHNWWNNAHNTWKVWTKTFFLPVVGFFSRPFEPLLISFCGYYGFLSSLLFLSSGFFLSSFLITFHAVVFLGGCYTSYCFCWEITQTPGHSSENRATVVMIDGGIIENVNICLNVTWLATVDWS